MANNYVGKKFRLNKNKNHRVFVDYFEDGIVKATTQKPLDDEELECIDDV